MSSKPNIFVFIGADKQRLGRIFKQAVIILQYRQFGNIEFRNIVSLEILQYQNIVSQAILKYQNIASLEFSQYCESGNMLPLLVVLSLHCKSDRDLHLGMRCSPEYYLLKKMRAWDITFYWISLSTNIAIFGRYSGTMRPFISTINNL